VRRRTRWTWGSGWTIGLLVFCVLLAGATERRVSPWDEPLTDPVLGGIDRAYYPCVVEIDDTFHMWYTDKSGGGYRIAHTTSSDGVNWAPPELVTGFAGQPHHVVVANVGTEASPHFRIWYAEATIWPYTPTLMRTAESADGLAWINDQTIGQANNLVRENDSSDPVYPWAYGSYGPGAVLYNPDGYASLNTLDPMGNRYVMYYDQYTRYWLTGVNEVTMLAISDDGVHWTRYGDAPVLQPAGGTTAWDAQYAYVRAVVLVDGTYHAWYSGGIADSNDGIGHAFSTDGIHWTKADQPVLHADDPAAPAWRASRSYAPAVIRYGDSFAMWLSGKDGGDYVIGYATAAGPYPTIQTAIDAADPGDEIQVTAGSYQPASTINVNKDNLRILGPQAGIDPRPSVGSGRTAGSPGEAIVEGTRDPAHPLGKILFIDASNIEINGLEIRYGTSDMIRQSDPHSGTAVRYCLIHGGLGDEGVQLKQCTGGVMEYNYVYDIAWAGDGLNFADSQDCTVRYNELTAIDTDNAAIYIYGSDNTSIVGNLIHDLGRGEGIKLGNKGGSDASRVGGLIQGNLIYNLGGPNNDDAIAIYTSHVQVLENEVFHDASENGAIYMAFGLSDIVLERNVVRDNALLTTKWAEAAGILIGEEVNAASVEIHYNSIFGNTPYGLSNITISGDDVDATLNWWGDASGPTHPSNPDGSGDAITDRVIYSPWLGTDPDGNPVSPGVQITGPVRIITAPIGPESLAGYLNDAIVGSNTLGFADTIEVRPGNYTVSEVVRDSTVLISSDGAAATTLNGPLVLDSAQVLVGRMREGFTINGPITVPSDINASTIEIHWNDLYGLVTNDGKGVLDATYNYWGEDGPDTVGRVRTHPDLPVKTDTVIGYIDDYGFNVHQALAFLRLLERGHAAGWAMTAIEVADRFGMSVDEAVDLIADYGLGAVMRALRRSGTLEEFLVQLIGYGSTPATAGGGGSIQSIAVGDELILSLELTHPVTGEPVTDAIVSYSVCRFTPDESTAIVAFGVMPFDGSAGEYRVQIDTAGLEPGLYTVYLGSDDGRFVSYEIQILP